MSIFNDLKSVWSLLFAPLLFSIFKLWNQNELYQRRNTEKFKTIINNILRFIALTITALLYLLLMFSYSFSAYPTKEVTDYITNWEHIGNFVILIILYAIFFPIIILPFWGKRRSKRFFVEIINNQIIRREVIDRVTINNQEKLILKDADGFQTEKDITDLKNLKFETPYKKTWLTKEDIKKFALYIKGKNVFLRSIICIFILAILTFYTVWTVKDIIGVLNYLHQKADIYMYIGLFTLPAILIVELYIVVYLFLCQIFQKNILSFFFYHIFQKK